MDYAALLEQMKGKSQDLSKYTMDIPNIQKTLREDLYGNDNVIDSLRSNEADKIKELYQHDQNLADRYANPSSEGYIEDPYVRAKATAQRSQATAGELGTLQNQIAKRSDVLGSALEKAMQLLNYGLEAKKLEYAGIQDEFDNKMKLEDFQLKKEQSRKETQADQQSAAYDQMIKDLRGRITLPEALVRYSKYFSPNDIYAAYNQVNNDPSRKANYGPAKEAPESLARYGITSSGGTFGYTQAEVAAGVAGQQRSPENIQRYQQYIQSQDSGNFNIPGLNSGPAPTPAPNKNNDPLGIRTKK